MEEVQKGGERFKREKEKNTLEIIIQELTITPFAQKNRFISETFNKLSFL
jgi:hypothetical protein